MWSSCLNLNVTGSKKLCALSLTANMFKTLAFNNHTSQPLPHAPLLNKMNCFLYELSELSSCIDLFLLELSPLVPACMLLPSVKTSDPPLSPLNLRAFICSFPVPFHPLSQIQFLPPVWISWKEAHWVYLGLQNYSTGTQKNSWNKTKDICL